MTNQIYHLLDVFTDQRFGGNQLAVFPDATNIPENLFQKIANEFNLSETVFMYPRSSDGSYDMRIFTPAQELPTAGHPTIGTAFYLAQQLNAPLDGPLELTLNQKVGKIRVTVTFTDGSPSLATMYQPLPEFLKVFEDRKMISALLNLDMSDLMDLPAQVVSCGVPYLIIPVRTIDAVKKVRFRLDIWDKVQPQIGQGFVYAFTPSGQRTGSDLHGRMFAPEAGILEDPATGSANGPLGCYVTQYGLKKGKMVSEQGFELGRPSIIHLEIGQNAAGHISEVKVGGQAVFVGKGEFFGD